MFWSVVAPSTATTLALVASCPWASRESQPFLLVEAVDRGRGLQEPAPRLEDAAHGYVDFGCQPELVPGQGAHRPVEQHVDGEADQTHDGRGLLPVELRRARHDDIVRRVVEFVEAPDRAAALGFGRVVRRGLGEHAVGELTEGRAVPHELPEALEARRDRERVAAPGRLLTQLAMAWRLLGSQWPRD